MSLKKYVLIIFKNIYLIQNITTKLKKKIQPFLDSTQSSLESDFLFKFPLEHDASASNLWKSDKCKFNSVSPINSARHNAQVTILSIKKKAVFLNNFKKISFAVCVCVLNAM